MRSCAVHAFIFVNLKYFSFQSVQPVIEGNDLGGADEGEVQGVEEQHHVPARVVGQAHLTNLK